MSESGRAKLLHDFRCQVATVSLFGNSPFEHETGENVDTIIQGKLEAGKKLSSKEETYLMRTNPIMFAQYRRIQWPTGCRPELALVANGAILLEHGEVDLDWQKESQEQIKGFASELEQLQERLSLTEEFHRCRMVDDSYLFIPFDSVAAFEYGYIRHRLKTLGTPIGANDLLIAAHAKALNLILVTHNTREFSRVDGLKLEDWAA